MPSQKILNIHELLKKSSLLVRSGSVLYSGDETIQNGDWYFLGSNPGGHDDEKGADKIEDQLLKHNKSKSFNEYFEGEWTNSIHQENIKDFFSDLNLDLKKILSTNLCFVRSPMESKYKSLSEEKTSRQQRNEDNEKCWTIHEYLLSEVKPRFIICNGTTARDFIVDREKYGRYGSKFKNKMKVNYFEEEVITSGGLKCTFNRGDLILKDKDIHLKDIGIFSVPHMGFYTYYKESTTWIRQIMKSQFGIKL
jgi:hypothetical protein